MLADGTEKHPNTPSQEMQENARKYVRIRAIFHPLLNGERQEASVFLNSPELTVPENTRNFLRTREGTIFSKSSSNGEHWKTSVYLNSRAFAARENARKAQEDF